MQILVTGGMGFIGSHLVLHLLQNLPEARVINLDSLSYAANPRNLEQVERMYGKRYQFIHGNIADGELMNRLMPEAELVFNLAAETHVDRSLHDPDVFMRTNVLGVSTMLQAAVKAWQKFPERRFIHISTDEVYGSLSLEDPARFTESTPLAPRSPYSASKASADLLALAYYHSFNLPVVVTRASNNYGPHQFPEKFIPLMIRRALSGRELPVYGDGLYVRDWLFVKDHCRGLAMVAQKGRPGQVYNIGGNNQLNNLTLLNMILASLGAVSGRKPEEFGALIRHVQDRPGHDRRYDLDCRKIEQELGFIPEVNFAQGLNITTQWYVEHENWWPNSTEDSQLWLKR